MGDMKIMENGYSLYYGNREHFWLIESAQCAFENEFDWLKV